MQVKLGLFCKGAGDNASATASTASTTIAAATTPAAAATATATAAVMLLKRCSQQSCRQNMFFLQLAKWIARASRLTWCVDSHVNSNSLDTHYSDRLNPALWWQVWHQCERVQQDHTVFHLVEPCQEMCDDAAMDAQEGISAVIISTRRTHTGPQTPHAISTLWAIFAVHNAQLPIRIAHITIHNAAVHGNYARV